MKCPRCHSSNIKFLWEEPIYPELSPDHVPTTEDVSPAPFSYRRHVRCECCGEAFTQEPTQPKRFLGVMNRPDGTTVKINEETPADVLLDVIEWLQAELKREQTCHRRTMTILVGEPPLARRG